MSFGTILFTEKGRALQAKSMAGTALVFTKIAMGSGYLNGQSQITLTNLVETKVSLTIAEIKRNGQQATIKGNFTNADEAVGFYWREIGLFANDPDLGEILYCYGNAGVLAEYIPPESSSLIEKVISIAAVVGDASSVSAVIDSSVFASKQDIEIINMSIEDINTQLAQTAKQVDLDTTNANVALKASIIDLNATNIEVSLKVNRDEIGIDTYPLYIADWTGLYADRPTASISNKGGWLYCTDGDGTHGAGKYYSNGTSWTFGGTGDEGYNKTNKNLGDLTKSVLFGDAVYASDIIAITKSGVTINTSTRTISISNGTDGSGAGLIFKFKAPKKFNSGDAFRLVMLWDTNCYNYFQHVFGIYTIYGFTLSNATFDKLSDNKYLTIFEFVATSNIPYLSDLAYRITKNQYAFSGNAYMTITSACLYADGLKNYQYDLYNRVVKNNPVISSTSNLPVSDLNNAEINSVYTIAVTGVTEGVLANAPFYPFQGFIYTFGIIGVDNIKYQVAKSAVGNNTYYRTMWGTWSSWETVYKKEITFDYLENGLYTSFLKVGCIGDSLASGESYSNETGTLKAHDIYQHSWGQYMARMSGNTYYNFSNGGLTTRTFLSEQWMSIALDGNHDCTAYIIGLGVNDAGSTYHVDLGSVSDIDVNNYNNNADTYYGNYAKIIQKLKEHNSKVHFFVLTNPLSNDSYNTAVRTMPTIFSNVHLIDLYTDYRALYESGSFIAQNIRANHYNAIAYNYMAKILANAMCKLMYNNPSKFDQVEFIDTAYSYTV